MAARSRRSVVDDTPKTPSDAYVGLLGLSLLALTAAMLFAFLNWNAISEKPPKAVQMAPRVPAGGPRPGGPQVPAGVPSPAPARPAGVQPQPGVPPQAPQPGAPPRPPVGAK